MAEAEVARREGREYRIEEESFRSKRRDGLILTEITRSMDLPTALARSHFGEAG